MGEAEAASDVIELVFGAANTAQRAANTEIAAAFPNLCATHTELYRQFGA